MADNTPLVENAARNVATDQVTHSGDTADVQLVRVVETTGAEGSKTVIAHDHGAGSASSGTQRVVEANNSALTVAAQAIQAAVEAPTLPSGGATAARQDTGNTALAAILLAVDTLEALFAALNAAVSTAAKQDTGNASLASILSAVDGLETLATALNAAVATEATLATRASETTLSAVNTATGAQADLEATGNGSVIAILKRIRTLLASPLSVSGTVAVTGVATEAKQDTGNTSLASILSAVDGVEGLLTSILAAVDGLEGLLGGTLTVAGSVTANAGTNLNTSALALESGGNLATIAGAVRAEDAAHSSAHTGIMALAKRSDTPAATSDTDGDYEPLQVRRGRLVVDAIDRLRVSVQSAGLTTASTAYSAGDQMGTLFTIANAARVSGAGGEIVGVQLIDAADIIGPVDVVFFRASVTLAADNAAFAISDSDALELVGLVHLLGAYDLGNNRLCQAHGIRVPYDCSGGTSLYAALITRADHTFFAAVGNLQLVVQLIRD